MVTSIVDADVAESSTGSEITGVEFAEGLEQAYALLCPPFTLTVGFVTFYIL